jgi:outer membrane protein assembly factor BamB
LVYTTETIDQQTERVTAYALDSGERRWVAEWPGAMKVPFFAASNGSWIRATPVCVPGHLLVMGMRDVLVCLDPKSGREKWRVDFPATMATGLPAFGAVCSPIVDGDAVMVQTGGAVVRLSLRDGGLIWKTLENADGMMSSGAFSSPTIATIAGVRQLVVQTRQELCGVDLDTGRVFWREPIEAFRGMNILTPLVIGDRIFTSAHSGKAQLFEISRDSGDRWNVAELWNQKVQAYMSSPVHIDGSIYLHAKNQRLLALSAETGDIRWTSRPFGKYWSMVTNGEQILALDSSGELLLIGADPEKFDLVDRTKVADDSWAHLAVQDQYVIVRDLGSLRVFRWQR